MKVDPYKHKERYLSWKESVKNGIPDLSEANSKVVLDYIFDMGPEGGRYGGELLCEGTPEDLLKYKESHTAQFLKKEFETSLIPQKI